MEHPMEEIAAQAEAARAELRRRARNEPEGSRIIASSSSPPLRRLNFVDPVKDSVVSTSTLTNSYAKGIRFTVSPHLHVSSTSNDWPGNSTLTNIDAAMKDLASDGGLVSLPDSGPQNNGTGGMSRISTHSFGEQSQTSGIAYINSKTGISYINSTDNNSGMINLREWLESYSIDFSKNDKLVVFGQIVQIVDVAHCQGIGLLELFPSSFTLSETGRIKYIGSILEVEGDQDRICVKKQKVDKSRFVYEPEKKWYAFPEGFNSNTTDLFSFNIYCLGLLLFEFLCRFESMEAHTSAMQDLHDRILPPHFLSENPKEAGFCFWLLHPEPSSRPTTREILRSELIYGLECDDKDDGIVDDAESELMLHFLVSLKNHKQNKASNLLEDMHVLDSDIKEVERRHKYLDKSSGSKAKVLRDELLGNLNQLQNAYFSVRSNEQLTDAHDIHRSDKDVLRNRERSSWGQKPVDSDGKFFDDICKFARYSKFEVCGKLRNSDILYSNNVICSLSFDRDEQYIAAAGVSKKIKIFEVGTLMDDYGDVQYPVLEMSNKSKFSCICWNNYIKNYLASTDYDGLVQMWDASTGQGFLQYKEHQKRAWSVDFCKADPTKFASGSDDCSVRIWNVNEGNSTATIWNPANVCCVQFSPYSSHLLAFGSADYRVYCYDIRHTRNPWCTLGGHGKTVSYVRFLDSETIVSASTDSTLKLWDLKKTTLEGFSTSACSLTFGGHTNEKNFVGLAVLDGYIACGSETNEVYTYYKSLPMPITRHRIGCNDPISGADENDHFVSSVCWRRRSHMLASANSNGNIEILRMV